eukprot:6211778-Pleurochrysis_carterae.AAC.1
MEETAVSGVEAFDVVDSSWCNGDVCACVCACVRVCAYVCERERKRATVLPGHRALRLQAHPRDILHRAGQEQPGHCTSPPPPSHAVFLTTQPCTVSTCVSAWPYASSSLLSECAPPGRSV